MPGPGELELTPCGWACGGSGGGAGGLWPGTGYLQRAGVEDAESHFAEHRAWICRPSEKTGLGIAGLPWAHLDPR